MTIIRAQAPEQKTITSLEYPGHELLVLSNGIRLYCIDPMPFGVAKLNSHWSVGSMYESSKFQAKTALMLSLNGSTLNTASEILEQFDFWGSSFSPSVGVLNSGFDLKSTSAFFNETFDWFFKHFENAAYPIEEIETWKQTHIAGLGRKMATPKYWSYRQCMELLFGTDSPMSRFTNPEDIQSITGSAAGEFKRDFLNASSAQYFLSGDYGQETINRVVGYLENLPSSLIPAPINTHESAVSEVTEKIHPVENTSQVSMFMARELPQIGEVEYHHFSLLNTLLGGFFGSRLMQDIREEKGLTYGIGSYIQQTHNGNMWCISGEMNSANAGLALDETKKLLRGMITHPAMGDELERAKRYYTGQLRSGFDGPFAMAAKLRSLIGRGYSLRHFDTAMNAIWSCSTEDLCSLADNYLHPESFKTVLAGDIR